MGVDSIGVRGWEDTAYALEGINAACRWNNTFRQIKGVGSKTAQASAAAGLTTVSDALNSLPREHMMTIQPAANTRSSARKSYC